MADDLVEGIATVFEQVQLSLANHKKNCVALYKIHTRAAEVVHGGRKGAVVTLVGEHAFQDVCLDMASRVLEVKKGNGAAGAERVVKFLGTFVRYMNEKGMLGFLVTLAYNDLVRFSNRSKEQVCFIVVEEE